MTVRSCILDGSLIKDAGMLQDILAEALNLPAWYGRNMDALYDCLTDMQEETEIIIHNPEELKEHLGKYADIFLKVIKAAADENPKIYV